MSIPGERIVELDMKLQFLMSHHVPRRVLGHAATMVDFANQLGAKRETLRDAKSTRRISSTLQSVLAVKLGFRLDWPEWQSGTAAAFQDRYLRERYDPAADDASRRVGAPLARGPRRTPMACGIGGLAAVEVDGAQFGPGTASVEVTVSCGMPVVLGARTTVKSGRLDMKFAPAVLTRDTLMDWMQGEKLVRGARGPVHVSFEAGTRSAPSWRLTAEGSSLGVVMFDPDFVGVEELAPGDEITVEFGTWLGDVDEDDSGVGDGIALMLDADGATTEAVPLSKRRQRVIECIRKELLCSDANGYAVLARHVLQVVEART